MKRIRVLWKCDEGPEGEGWTDEAIAAALDISARRVGRWCRQNADEGPEALKHDEVVLFGLEAQEFRQNHGCGAPDFVLPEREERYVHLLSPNAPGLALTPRAVQEGRYGHGQHLAHFRRGGTKDRHALHASDEGRYLIAAVGNENGRKRSHLADGA